MEAVKKRNESRMNDVISSSLGNYVVEGTTKITHKRTNTRKSHKDLLEIELWHVWVQPYGFCRT